MADFPTYRDLERVSHTEILRRSTSLTRDIVERKGSDANALVAAPVAVGDECIGQLIQVESDLFLDSATGAGLQRWVYDRYGILKKPASPAVGQVQFTQPAPAVLGFLIPIGTQLKTSDGKVFVTTADVNFPTGSAGPITAPVQSQLAGISQQARAGTITSISSSVAGALSLQVTNALATAGADDAESDDSLKDRARNFYKTSKRGTLSAIENGALAVPGVRNATVFETITPEGDPARVVELVVSDAFTDQLIDADSIPAAYTAQADVFGDTVRAALDDVRAAGIQVIVTIAVPTLIGIRLALRFRAGFDIDSTTTQARSTVVSFTNSLRPGDTFDPVTCALKLQVVPGLVVQGDEVVSPSGPVLAGLTEVIRTSLGMVTV